MDSPPPPVSQRQGADHRAAQNRVNQRAFRSRQKQQQRQFEAELVALRAQRVSDASAIAALSAEKLRLEQHVERLSDRVRALQSRLDTASAPTPLATHRSPSPTPVHHRMQTAPDSHPRDRSLPAQSAVSAPPSTQPPLPRLSLTDEEKRHRLRVIPASFCSIENVARTLPSLQCAHHLIDDLAIARYDSVMSTQMGRDSRDQHSLVNGIVNQLLGLCNTEDRTILLTELDAIHERQNRLQEKHKLSAIQIQSLVDFTL